MSKAEIIRSNAQHLRELYDAMHPEYGNGNRRLDVNDACREFHESYDRLAFPGGLDDWLIRLRTHDQDAIEDAVLFLEVDPIFFRSGYIKEWVLDQLRWAPLKQDQKRRLQQVILARVRDPTTRREFRRYCRLAPFISNPEFEQELARLAGPSGTKPKRALWVLDHLRQGVPKQKER
jgi:hypothetical protein